MAGPSLKFIAIDTHEIAAAVKAMDRTARLDVNRGLKAEWVGLTTKVMASAKGRAGTKMRINAAGTLRQLSSAGGAAIGYGDGIPYWGGAEFGAFRDIRRATRRGLMRGWNQFDHWRGNSSDAGYFLWPAIRDTTRQETETLAERLAEIIAKGDT